MIYGTGNDLVELDRITRSVKNQRFQEHCFSPAERDLYGEKPLQLAGCFAAKEAFSKALGTGVRGFSLKEISVLRNDLGKPYFVFTGRILEIMQHEKLAPYLALTHSGNYVIANVILEVNHETDHVVRTEKD